MQPQSSSTLLRMSTRDDYYNINLTPKTHTQSLFDHPKNFLVFTALPMWKDDYVQDIFVVHFSNFAKPTYINGASFKKKDNN